MRDGTARGFLSFTRFARKAGVIGWEYPQASRDRSERRRIACDEALAEQIAAWAKELEIRHYAPRSRRQYARVLFRLGEYLARAKIFYRDLDSRAFTRWALHLRTKGQAPGYVMSHANTARSFYGWLSGRGAVTQVPRLLVSLRAPRESRSDFLTEGETRRLIAAARSVRDRAYVEFLYASGCRNGEALDLDLEDVDLESRSVRCRGKTGERQALLSRPAVRAIRKYLAWRSDRLREYGRTREKALFVTAVGRRLSTRYSAQILKDLALRAGIAKCVSPQLLRRTFASHLVNHGADLGSVQRLLGHSRIDETARYARLAPVRLRAAYRCSALELSGRRLK